MALSGLSTGSLYIITVPSFKHLETNHPVGACAKKAKWNDWTYWNSLRNEGWAGLKTVGSPVRRALVSCGHHLMLNSCSPLGRNPGNYE